MAIPGPNDVNEGGTGTYTCTATYDDGTTQDVTGPAGWLVASGPGSFSGAGSYAAPGTVTQDTPVSILASYSEGGLTKLASRVVTVKNSVRVLSGVTISGPNEIAGGAQQITSALPPTMTAQRPTSHPP